MLLKLYEEHIIYILNMNKCIKESRKYSLISKYIYNLVKDDLTKLFYNYITINPLLENWKYKLYLSNIMYNIKTKLYNNNVISLEFYKVLNCNSIIEFDNSIGYPNYLLVEAWIDIFSFNDILWNYDEIWFLKTFYDISITYLT
jgi:hypothetical protein